MTEGKLRHNHIRFANTLLSIASFIICAQCILSSHHPQRLAIPAIATLAIFILARGNGNLLFPIIAFGPILNLSAFRHGPDVYNVEIVLLTFLGCWFWKNEVIIGNEKDGVLISYGIMLGAILASSAVHLIFQHGYIPGELRLARPFLIGGFLLLFLKNFYGERWLLYYKSVIASALIVDAWGIMELLVTGPAGSFPFRLPHSVFDGSEMLAIYLCTVIPLLLAGRAEPARKFWARGAVAATFVSFLLLLATRSRSALIAVVTTGLYWFYKTLRQRKYRGYSEAAAIGFAALCAVGMIGLKTFTSTPQSITKAVTMLFSSRLGVWALAVACFRANPVWGSGPQMNVYNIYMQLLCQFGIIGLAAFLLLLFSLFNRYHTITATEIKGRMAQGALLSVTAFFIASMGESTMGNQFAYYAWFLLFLAEGPSTEGGGHEVRHHRA